MCDVIRTEDAPESAYVPIPILLSNPVIPPRDPPPGLPPNHNYPGIKVGFSDHSVMTNAAGHYYFCLPDVLPEGWTEAWAVSMAFKLKGNPGDPWHWIRTAGATHPFFQTNDQPYRTGPSDNPPDKVVGLLVNDARTKADPLGGLYRYVLVVAYKEGGSGVNYVMVDPEIHNEGGGPGK